MIIQSDNEISKYEQLISFVGDRPGHDLRYAIDAEKFEINSAGNPRKTSSADPKKRSNGISTMKADGREFSLENIN